MGVRGPKGYGEELKIKQRYADLSEKVFSFYMECFESEDKADKKWAAEQVAKGLIKMIPQDIVSGGEQLKIIPLLSIDEIRQHNSNPEDSQATKED